MSRKIKKSSGLKKKIIIIGVIAALVGSTLAVALPRTPPEEDRAKTFLCGSGFANSNRYVQEFVIPTECAEPVGIVVDEDGIVWFAESATRKVGKFDPTANTFEEYPLPGAKAEEEVKPVASIWSMRFDDQGNLWFPDVATNAIWKFNPRTQIFETYKIPSTSQFGTSYPINIDFDDTGRIWFSEIYGKNLGVLDPSATTHNTIAGITEISTEVPFETLGPLAFDDDGNIWFTALSYPVSGKLLKFDPQQNDFTTYDLPPGVSSPVGIVADGQGNLWINDHGTSMIMRFNMDTSASMTYATSLPLRKTSIGLYEKCLLQPNGSPITCAGFPVSLPYWNAIDKHGRLWFNEHQGNSIAVFDPKTETLIEYFIPTQNPAWGACENYLEPCGIANPLQLTIAPDGKIWFSEWSDNKIGVVNSNLALPISLAIDKNNLKVSNGKSASTDLTVTANEALSSSVQMRISGTIVPTGRLFNVTAQFSEQELTFREPSTKVVNLTLTPDNELSPGEYRITVSARYNEVTYSRIIHLTVVPSMI
ncbi:MAG: SMP-30/gluconolactonase/LRE family protein [Nitrososphaerales archaeon]